jgi:Protein of unknown function (DUF2934)
MTEQDSPIPAVGSYLDDETEIAALAYRFYEQEGRPEGRANDHWSRAEREFRERARSMSLNRTQAEQIFGNHAGEL